MRPIPARKHHLSIAALLVLTAANTLLTFRDPEITDEQAGMVAEVIKQSDPSLYAGDPVFGETGPAAPWRLRPPAWRALLAAAWRITGSDDPAATFRLLGAAALTVYLLLMYTLVYRQTHSTTAGVLIAMMSTAIFSVRRPYWGMGPIFSVTPTAIVVTFVPLIALLFIRSWSRRAVIGVFFLAGLVGNIEPHLALGLSVVLLVALLGLRGSGLRAWMVGGAGLAAAAVGIAPTICHYVVLFRAAGRALPAMTIPQLRQILGVAGIQALYPEVLIQAVRLLPMVAALGIPAVIILSRGGRYRVRESAAWLWLLGAIVVVAFALHGLMQLIGHVLGAVPPTLSLFGTLRLAMLPLYVLLAQSAVHLIRIARTHRGLVRAVLAAYVATFLASSYNTLPLRHMAQDAVARLAGRPIDRRDRHAQAERRSICRWIRSDDNTSVDATIVTDQAEVRPLAGRAISCAAADIHYLYHLAPETLTRWAECVRTQRDVLVPPHRPKADPDAIVRFADSLVSTGPRPEMLVLVPARSAPDAAGRLVEVLAPPLAVPPEQAEDYWGLHWRLYRILPTAPATGPAGPSPPPQENAPGSPPAQNPGRDEPAG